MKIRKILNNNLVLANDWQGNEIIVKGRGIGFNKKRWDTIEEAVIEKIFTPENSKKSKELQSYLTSIPEDYLDFVQGYVDYIKNSYDIKLNNSIYVSLSDHLTGTIKRFNEGISINNLLLLDIKQLYKLEYKIGLDMLEKLNEKFNVNLPLDEAGFIALHFVNAQDSEGKKDGFQISHIVNEIMKIVKRYYASIVFDEESLYYQRFITHLKYFAQRFLHKELNYKEDAKLFEIIKNQYKEAYGCVKLIYLMMEDKYNYQLTEEEMLYLTMHIQSIKEKSIL
ncbi:BglG family transcription antiterminator LicT [Clostridium sp.]|uniref:BglG family transcription antiterminator LicT n=1 Tax=Clostridium sp. TaxID=1506 RepID=UPI0025BB72CA|nr:PRD domain-containing protein [Clostridium sp.]MCI9304731.1 PRD domain-containing protein [Clostridium sp.]